MNLSSKIWNICNLFRGSLDASKFKDYILILFFVWYLSEENKKNDKNDKYSFLFKDKKILNLKHPDIFGYLFGKKDEDNFGEIINREFSVITKNNGDKLRGIFEDVNFNSEILGNTGDRNNLLRKIFIEWENIDFDKNRNIIGDVYEELISKFAGDSGKMGGNFLHQVRLVNY